MGRAHPYHKVQGTYNIAFTSHSSRPIFYTCIKLLGYNRKVHSSHPKIQKTQKTTHLRAAQIAKRASRFTLLIGYLRLCTVHNRSNLNYEITLHPGVMRMLRLTPNPCKATSKGFSCRLLHSRLHHQVAEALWRYHGNGKQWNDANYRELELPCEAYNMCLMAPK